MVKNTDYSVISQILQEFVDVKTMQISSRSLALYLHKLVQLEQFLSKSSTALENLDRQRIATFLQDAKAKGNSAATLNSKLAAIRVFAKWLWEEDRLSDKEYRKISEFRLVLPKGENNHHALTSEEEKQGLEQLSMPIYHMLFWTGLNYGLRLSEYRNLRIHDVDLEQGKLIIRLSKGQKTRAIPIIPAQKDVWQRWFDYREGLKLSHDFVFFSVNGKLISRGLERYFNKISELLDLPLTSHTLRRTYATKLWRAGVDLLVISKMLGHANIQTTQKYLRVTEEELRERYLRVAVDILG